MAQISKACNVQQIYLRAVLSSAIASGLVEQKTGVFPLTKKGAMTAIYILIVNDGMNYKSGDYRALMRALDRLLESDVQVFIINKPDDGQFLLRSRQLAHVSA